MKWMLELLIGLLCLNCSSDNHCEDQVVCDSKTIIDPILFENAPRGNLRVNELSINNHCLTINFSSSGCSGRSWIIVLVDSGVVSESIPAQRFLRLSLKNDEMCEAFLTREMAFDISNLQVEGNQVLLNIVNSDKSVLYQY